MPNPISRHLRAAAGLLLALGAITLSPPAPTHAAPSQADLARARFLRMLLRNPSARVERQFAQRWWVLARRQQRYEQRLSRLLSWRAANRRRLMLIFFAERRLLQERLIAANERLQATPFLPVRPFNPFGFR